MLFKSGVIKVKAKYPYTTVGIPARISRAGLSHFLQWGEANSLRKVAVKRPKGSAREMERITIINVPDNKGRTPKDLGSNKGAQWVPNKKSLRGTF